MPMISCAVRHNQEIQENQANQGSDNFKGAGAPFSQRENHAHQVLDD